MPRIKRSSSPVDQFDEDFDDDSCSSKNGNPPIQRNAANARERARMRVLSSAFGRLKTKLPNIPPDTKLSKLDTLRLATIYIKQLKTLVEGTTTTNSENAESTINITDIKTLNFQQCSQSMTWPFAFQHIHAAGRQLALQFPTTNWESSSDTEKTNQKNDTRNLNDEQINESTANLFQNKCHINSGASNVSNRLFDCLHQQQQQQLNYYIHRNHYDYHEPNYADHQHPNMQIH